MNALFHHLSCLMLKLVRYSNVLQTMYRASVTLSYTLASSPLTFNPCNLHCVTIKQLYPTGFMVMFDQFGSCLDVISTLSKDKLSKFLLVLRVYCGLRRQGFGLVPSSMVPTVS